MMRQDVRLLLDLAIGSIGMVCPNNFVIVLYIPRGVLALNCRLSGDNLGV